MIVGHLNELEFKNIVSPEVQGASIAVLVSPREGWEGHVMRVLEVEPNGFTPKHSHPWYHVNYVIEGSGELMIDHKYYAITSGSYAYVPGNTIHQFKNTGKTTLKFICIVIESGHK
ncbi:MAG: cupin domain-containing protein [Acholeplasmataceae bacterium]|jgi:quercetin dioxygenase-like cupin family protein|nr:cupin domain-containing protein [Acholeplasmataceae bacterium]